MEKMKLYEAVRVVPAAAKKEIQAGRLRGMTDINPMWRINRAVRGLYRMVFEEFIKSDDQIAFFVNINLYVKIGWRMVCPYFW